MSGDGTEKRKIIIKPLNYVVIKGIYETENSTAHIAKFLTRFRLKTVVRGPIK